MVTYIRSDLDFILAQIKIAEAHSAGQPLFGAGGLVPAYNVAWGLRTVDGSYNHLLPGQETWGAAGAEFPELIPPVYRPADGTPFDPDGPMGPAPSMPTAPNYNPSNNPNSLVFDSSLRTISNLLVDQTLGNPAAILTALERAGSASPMTDLPAVTAIYQAFKPAWDAEYQARVVMQNAKTAADALGDGDPGTPPTPEEQAALDALAAATSAHAATVTALDAARVVRDAALEPFGIAMQGDNVHLPAVAPDEGLSAPFNSWFTLFGQFFDHGLDLINKGGSGTVFIPLQPDDPLYVEGSHTNFMVLTRATVSAGPDNVMGTADDVRPVNTTTAYVDQNQTYASHASHQVFLRQYAFNAAGDPVATGKLIEGANGGMATWGEVKLQAKTLLGINLTDADVGAVPLLRTDPYGNFIPGTNGFPQVIIGIGADGIPNTADDVVIEGDPTANGGLGISTTNALRTASAFLADIAHEAVPIGKIADGDITIGLGNPGNGDTEYDNELLDAHFIAGDGRVNENIGLTAVHHVFHAEHNRLVQHTKDTVLASNDLAFINEWLEVDLAALPTPAQVATLVWDGERLFQAAKFGTEMQYQHLVFEEFARKVQPNINVFLVPDGFDTTIDPSIVAEFAHVVYRFGHSMLTESIDRFDPSFNADHIGLIEGFLNPLAFDGGDSGIAHSITDDVAAGAIIRGMTRQVGNEIDEFVTTALRNNLLGLPLDLATINLARGRDTGVPSLNAARRTFYEATNEDVLLKPYESWADFAGHLKHEASIINFIAAYGTHAAITSATTLEAKRDAALALIIGDGNDADGVTIAGVTYTDRFDFLNATGAYAGGVRGGLENVDLWIGGLAEEIMPFGGMLGSTFNFVFEVQMEKLQNGDRFYYLQRLDGLHLFGEMENNSFAAMIMRNTDATHLPSDVFSTPGLILEVDRTKQYNPGLGEDAGADGILEDDPLTTAVDESADNRGLDPLGTSLLTPLVIRDNPATPGVDTNYLRYTGGDHVVLGGTEANDTLIAGIGDDTLFGDGGNDLLEGGFGNDIINGGDGDDIIKDSGGDDNIKAGRGNDVVHAGPGLDLVMGNDGHDFIFLGTDMGSEVFAGTGNDYIYGNKNAERILGNEGNDWIETGTFDGAPGDNFDEVFAQDGIDGHDVFLGDGGFDEFIAEGGDDIMVGSAGRGKMAGMSGFDWATYKDNTMGVDADFTRGIVFDENPTPPANGTLDAYESVEGLSGSRFNDVLTGSDVTAAERLPFAQGGSEGYRGSQLTKEGLALIAGLREVLGLSEAQVNALAANAVVYNAGEIILGGDGSDVIMGRGGDDIIDGDKWLDVNIAVMSGIGPDGGVGTVLEVHKSMTTLAAKMFNGTYNPGQLRIIRDIKTDTTTGDIDTAKYQGLRSDYTFSATADGQVTVTDVTELNLDGSDKLRNIERLEFSNGSLGIIVGTPGNDVPLNGTAGDDLILGLAGADTLNGLAGNDILVGGPGVNTATYVDNFNTASLGNSNGTAAWDPDWVETGDSGGTTSGQIRIDNGNDVLQFIGGTPAGSFDGAQIQRTVNLAGATAATLTYSIVETGLDLGDDTVTVFFSRDGTTFVQVDLINDATNTVPLRTIDLSLFGTGPFTANAAIRFVASSLEAGDSVNIDTLTINFTNPALNTGVDTLNGGLGDDTYAFALGDGNDVINELANEGAQDRISILAPATGVDIDGLPILTLNSLSMADDDTDNNDGSLVITYGLPNGAQTVTQQITVNNHFDGTNAQSGVERINFNGAVYAGYLLGTEDYLISRDDGGADLSASIANNVIVGESTGDTIIGGAGNDLIFGAAGDNTLTGGDGDDLIVGGAGAGDDDVIDGGLGADTMVGGGGNDDYIVDDLLDVVVEAAGAGTDEVFTELAALSIELMANVENLTYTGIDADQFVGTGNAGNNVISGGDLADTLSGLAGNDTLQGGLGADTMIGGDGNDIYEVDEAGDIVTEANADLVTGGTDRVESDVDYTLGANLENLDLNGTAVRGTGNILNNVINGNGQANQLFGAGGNDTLNGDDGNDLLDGGDGNDTISGGDDNDTIIGGAGNDTIDVGGGFNTIVYNAPGFGADTINSFDSAGGTPATQDRIDLSGLGVTAANFNNRVFESASGANNTLITIRENGPASAIQGTILINGSNTGAIDISDFTLAAAAPTSTITGTNAANTLNGVGTTSETINALGGNDTVNANGGNDVVNGGEGADTLNGGDGNDTLSGGTGIATANYVDNFEAASQGNSNGTNNWGPDWVESGDSGGTTTGQIRIDAGNNNVLQFIGGNGGDFNGAQIQRSVDLAGATAATLNYSIVETGLDAGDDTITVFFSRDGVNFVQVDLINDGTNTVPNRSIDLSLFGTGPFTANAAVRFVASSLETGDSVNIDALTINATGSFGADTVNGDAGDDTIIWNANAAAPTDGRDIVNGGTEGAVGDTFVINGNASAEAYTIYTRAAWLAVAGNTAASLNAATEIVVTRNGSDNASVIAELTEIEEIRINGVDPSGAGGTIGGDTFTVVGDFSTTSLRLNTITIDGQAGDDTVNISALSSAHRIVFRSNGGNDTIVGTLRPQDVIELPDGAVPEDYEVTTDENGVTTMTSPSHSICFTSEGGMPQFGSGDHEDDEDEDDEDPGHDDDDDEDDDDHHGGDDDDDDDDHHGHDDDDDDCGCDDEDGPGDPAPNPSTGSLRVGTAQADVLLGTSEANDMIGLAGDDVIIGGDGEDNISAGEGNDFVNAGEGFDIVQAGAGDDVVFGGSGGDVIDGEAGDDRIFGESGDDLITAGAGNDTVIAGSGNDLITGAVGDGDDTYFGDDSDGGTGIDTLDLSAITANLTVDLGNGLLGRGSASSAQSGTDTLWSIENVATGSGSDTITASKAVNVMEGGAGDDTFRFLSAEGADGDTILDFEPGDRLDLSGIDADSSQAGNQSFTLVNGPITGAGQVAVTYEMRVDGEYTIISGSTDANTDDEFRIDLKGSHSLSGGNFNL
ncbi:peroxidase family protein [Bosea sp. BK604]|uniref:peroxidase family protein n=1 Tax=Bosea sp. BK604 TaxID=2512180 RepID=UPI00104E323F|nr:peroxidase family protein [Bosea sp. BK604]TCR68507.1 Ca2+-binding RTX toxin-like protein [Bosea sp. BK604]